MYKKIISLLLVIATLCSFLVVPASAEDILPPVDEDYGGFISGVVDFADWAIDESFYAIKLIGSVFSDEICPERVGSNTAHSFAVDTVTVDGVLGNYYVCQYCGFNSGYTADSHGFNSAYNQYVSALQSDLGSAFFGTYEGSSAIFVPLPTIVSVGAGFDSTTISKSEDGSYSCFFTGTQTKAYTPTGYSVGIDIKNAEFVAPVNARYIKVYSVGSDNAWSGNHIGGFINNVIGSNVVAGKTISSQTLCSMYGPQGSSGLPFTWNLSGTFYGVFVQPEGSSLPILQQYNSRPASIVGDYGIIGDDGTIIKVDGNMIVDESTNTVYNPVTNTTNNYTDYAFDYSDRSYNLTLEDGSTIKVVYGNENITIQEGDTIYNVYYLIPDDSGSGGGSDSGDTPSGEDMSWWKQAWTNFTDKLFSILGNGGSSVNPDTAPAVPDDEETGEKGYSIIDLFVVLKDGTWAFITGIVTTAYDGFTGFVESVSSAGSFFTFYDEESEDGILFVPLEGGETIWD